MHKKITIHFYQKEDISEEDNRGDVANSHCNSAAMNPVCWPSGSGHWSHILPTPAVPPADPLPTGLPIAAPLALPVLFPVAVLVFPCDGSCPRLWGDSRSHQQLTLVHPMRSYQSSCNIQYSRHMSTEALTKILR